MSYHKGQVLTYYFPGRTVKKLKKSNIITEYHRIVVLHQRETPFNTVIIAPITKASSLKTKSGIPSNYVELLKSDYPIVLDEDSYINLDMTMVVDLAELNKFEKHRKNITVILKEPDLYQLDYKITLTYEMNKYIKTELAIELHREFSNIIQFVDTEIRERVTNVIKKIENIELAKEIIEIVDYLTLSIKKEYIKNNIKKNSYVK